MWEVLPQSTKIVSQIQNHVCLKALCGAQSINTHKTEASLIPEVLTVHEEQHVAAGHCLFDETNWSIKVALIVVIVKPGRTDRIHRSGLQKMQTLHCDLTPVHQMYVQSSTWTPVDPITLRSATLWHLLSCFHLSYITSLVLRIRLNQRSGWAKPMSNSWGCVCKVPTPRLISCLSAFSHAGWQASVILTNTRSLLFMWLD